MTKKSEFGKGLVVCLAKFMEHFGNETLHRANFCRQISNMSKENQNKVMSDNPPSSHNYGKELNEYFKFWKTKLVPIVGSIKAQTSHDLTLWANGASDHLYEIEVPKGKEWNEIRRITKELKDKGLDMGHGSGLTGRRIYELKDLYELKKLTKKALILIDEKLGLKPDWGEY